VILVAKLRSRVLVIDASNAKAAGTCLSIRPREVVANSSRLFLTLAIDSSSPKIECDILAAVLRLGWN
jgi:hypothetical protein